jgi:hypothetical protein
MLANMIAMPFTTNKIKLSVIIAQSNRARPIPVTASGGMIATEIATPGRLAFRFGLIRAKLAAAPATIAMAMLITEGSVRAIISAVSSVPSPA